MVPARRAAATASQFCWVRTSPIPVLWTEASPRQLVPQAQGLAGDHHVGDPVDGQDLLPQGGGSGVALGPGCRHGPGRRRGRPCSPQGELHPGHPGRVLDQGDGGDVQQSRMPPRLRERAMLRVFRRSRRKFRQPRARGRRSPGRPSGAARPAGRGRSASPPAGRSPRRSWRACGRPGPPSLRR